MSHPIMFLDGSEDLSTVLIGTYDLRLVFLSVLVACVAGYTALLVSGRIANSHGRARAVWLAGGSVAMGLGIWTMHFVGMLAFHLPQPVNYQPVLTIVSILPGMIGAAVALRSMSQDSTSFMRLNASGLALGSGIGAMHYTGMAAMMMPGAMKYSAPVFVLSILVAHVLATSALYVKFVLARTGKWNSTQYEVMSGVIMGCAVSAMHYTGMAAAVYFPAKSAPLSSMGPSIEPLALAITVCFGTTTVLAAAIIATIVDMRLQGISDDLRASEERNRLILETAGDGILSTDATGRIVGFNAVAARIFGWSVDDAVGQNVSMLVPLEIAEQHDEFIARYLRTGESNLIGRARELTGRRSDGELFPIALTVSECVIKNERTFTGLVRDLTEKRALETQLLQAQKLEAIGQLAAGIAHEINTPAQYVGNNVDFLSDSMNELMELMKKFEILYEAAASAGVLGEVVGEVREALAGADFGFLAEEIPRALAQSSEGIKRVTKIVGAMKEFSHPGSHEMKPVNINRAIESTVTVASNEWRYVADLDLDLEQTLPAVPCLGAELNQVILNIVVNAAHAIGDQLEAGGAKGRITIRTRRDGDWVQIEIQDDGPGIPEATRTRVFDPFFTTKEVGRGTGQGLSIARSVVVDKHHGTIDVDSELGQGTTFRIRLPVGSETDTEEMS